MTSAKTKRPSLETLIENEDLGLESLHPGGLDTTQELARLCQIGKDTSVLEVASGTGESACYLSASLEARVVGIERSDFMIERARQKAKQRNLEIEFEQADAHQLPFGEAAFERVLSECTTCLLDKERAIREMVRVVKPGGYVGIHDICWQPDTPSKMKKRRMIRAYALGQGAGTQVLITIPWLLTVGEPTGLTRDILMTVAWVLNIIIAERVINNRSNGIDRNSLKSRSVRLH